MFCITSDKAGRRWVLTLAGIYSLLMWMRVADVVQVVAGAFLAGLVSIISILEEEEYSSIQ